MDRREAVEVLKTISELYPTKFEMTERKARVLVPELLKMDYSAVMSRLANYAIGHPFPPTISEIAVYPRKKMSI
ncbi:hypothetical protein [Halobacillus amylolyticus]|uniref:Endonuclease III n=1 Tax=Halobacillus amylolyticus TaxID=2932259 RepID=A0ABY4H9N1_9BACI|nr:hypothetical protein [Halobacillus amylolyticus]UOR11387.1 hypothetical protein MUO15_17595 [Halobacillus amylolyticus]